MAWIYLLLAGLCEIGWPLGLKMVEYATQHKLGYTVLATVSIALSGYLLFLAQKYIAPSPKTETPLFKTLAQLAEANLDILLDI